MDKETSERMKKFFDCPDLPFGEAPLLGVVFCVGASQVPQWANYVSIDIWGQIEAWGLKPLFDADLNSFTDYDQITDGYWQFVGDMGGMIRLDRAHVFEIVWDDTRKVVKGLEFSSYRLVKEN